MHILQPKHSKLSEKEAKDVLKKLDISISQLPKIREEDPALPEGCVKGDLIRIERKDNEKIAEYYRVVI